MIEMTQRSFLPDGAWVRRVLTPERLAPAALMGVAAMLRFAWLSQWPEFTADEGLWTNSTKNFLRFHDWFMDGQSHMLLSPLFHWLTLPVFYVFGSGIVTARYVSAVAGCGSVVLLWLLVRRLADDSDLAMMTAALFGLNEMAVQMARLAQTEAVQLCLMLLSLWLVTSQRRRDSFVAGLVLALACLTKINSAMILLVLAAWAMAPRSGTPYGSRQRFRQVLVASGVGLPITGIVLAALFAAHPQRMIAAYSFELNGAHFQGLAKPLVNVGLFGLAPRLAATTVLSLFRETPFLMVLSTIGLVLNKDTKSRRVGKWTFGAWYLFGMAFMLAQIYQPLHYFYLLTPAFAYFAALAIQSWKPAEQAFGSLRSSATRAFVVYAAFSLAYIGAGFVANRGHLGEVTAWVKKELPDSANLMAAGYLCTDVPNRAYAFYNYAETPKRLLSSIDSLHIDYVIYDRFEWSLNLRAVLAQHYTVVARWPFAVVYLVQR
jgi:4-amino-4-deoxy-L-arabinose transferase-like glycosyltransferase